MDSSYILAFRPRFMLLSGFDIIKAQSLFQPGHLRFSAPDKRMMCHALMNVKKYRLCLGKSVRRNKRNKTLWNALFWENELKSSLSG